FRLHCNEVFSRLVKETASIADLYILSVDLNLELIKAVFDGIECFGIWCVPDQVIALVVQDPVHAAGNIVIIENSKTSGFSREIRQAGLGFKELIPTVCHLLVQGRRNGIDNIILGSKS